MNRRNFSLALLAIVVAARLLVRGALRHGIRVKTGIDERQKRIDAARKDLQVITQVEISHIENQRKFAAVEELISSGELGREMRGRNGYTYSVRLEGNGISASAVAPILARLKPE